MASPKRCSATGRPSPRQMRARSEKRSRSLDPLRRKDRQISLTGRFARLRPASGPHGPSHAATLPLIEPHYSLVKDLGSDRSESLRQTRMWVLVLRQKPHSSSEAVRRFLSLPACGRHFGVSSGGSGIVAPALSRSSNTLDFRLAPSPSPGNQSDVALPLQQQGQTP